MPDMPPSLPGEPETDAANQQWGGRFSRGPAAILRDINASISFDQHLWRQDIAASRAHAAMLARVGIISHDDERRIADGLTGIGADIEAGRFAFDPALEDIHMNVEARLVDRIGDAGRRLHTARSRNDQVATDFRLWVREAIDATAAQLADLMRALVERAGEHAGDPMPGMTHLQTAQPVTLGHHFLAYVEMFSRDRTRLADARARLNECPLGAAALAGTSFPIDREATAAALRFDRPMANSLDAVSDRDFALEFLAAAAISAVHLSRLAEEIVLWCSAPFGFVRLSDALTTGSSIMPQKRNPDAAELCRAKTGRITGSLVALLTVMKGLPLAYSKDMQEDKQPVFEAAEAWALALAAMAGMVRDLRADTTRMEAAAGGGVLDGDGPRRLARARIGPAVPHRAPRHRPAGRAGRGVGYRARGPAALGDAGGGAAHHGGRVRRAHCGRLGRVAHQFWRHGAGAGRGGGGSVAGASRMRALLVCLALLSLVAGCGKRGSPQPPGPPDQVTFPRTYPAY